MVSRLRESSNDDFWVCLMPLFRPTLGTSSSVAI
jgi:hypothetical protein